MKYFHTKRSNLRTTMVQLTTLLLISGCADDGRNIDPTSATLAVIGSEAPLKQRPSAVPGRYIVVLNDNVTPSIAESLGRQYSDELFHVYGAAFKGFAASLSAASVQALQQNPHVKYIEEDYPVYLNTETDYNPGWGLSRIDERTLTSPQTYTFDYNGSGVNIYVIDSGIETSHSDFGGRALARISYTSDGGAGDDCNDHGTAVASVAAGNEYGVARGATLHSVRILGCESWALASRWEAGINWVIENHVKPAVINFSAGAKNWQDDISPGSMADALERATDAGIIVATSAGNDATDACSQSPANVARLFTVAGSNSNDERHSSSNYGTCVDLYAPGAGISAASTNMSYRHDRTGTSFAAPYVSGVAALWLQREPAASVNRVHEVISSNTTARAIRDNLYPNGYHPLVFSRLDPPPTASISGPEFIFEAGNYSWNATASGGVGNYDYSWTVVYTETNPQSELPVGGGPVAELAVNGCDGDFELRLKVTSGNAVGGASWFVFNMAQCN